MTSTAPNLDYTSRDYEGLRQSLLDHAKVAFPDWAPSSEGDFGVLMLELFAYTGDVLSYYCDRAQLEAYLPTATQRSSVLQIAALLGYVPHSGTPASGTLTFQTANPGEAVLVPKGTKVATGFIAEIDGQVVFETDSDILVPATGGTASVTVTEGETRKDTNTGAPLKIGESTGLPDQTFRLPNPGVYADTTAVFVAGEEWRPVTALLDADPADKVFSVFLDDQGYSWVRFGDAINGAIPALGLDVAVTYRTGYGAKGNLPAGRIVNLFDNSLRGVSVQSAGQNKSTATETSGGADPETTEQIRANAPRAFASQQRAVTLDDYRNFALAVPGILKANAVAQFFSSVTVYVIGPDGGVPSDRLQETVAEELQRRSLAGVSVTVGEPSQVPVNFGTTVDPLAVEVWPTYSRTTVQYQVEQAIKALVSFGNADLGQRMSVSDVYKTVMDVAGVRYVDIPMVARDDAAQTGTADIQFRAWEMPVLGELHVTTTGGLG